MLRKEGALYQNQIHIILRMRFCLLCRAADWKLDQPDWTGRLRVCAKGKECYIKIEDKTSGKLHEFQVNNLQLGNRRRGIYKNINNEKRRTAE